MGDDQVRPLHHRVLALMAVAAVLAAVVWFFVHDDDQPSGNQGGATSSAPRETPDAVEQVPETPPPGGVDLPTGAARDRGYPVEFPHTDLGAVAVQIEVARAQIGFAYDHASEVAEIYAADDDREVFVDRARDGVELARKQAGVRLDGAAKAPASYATTPVAFTVEEFRDDYYVVNVLCYLSITTVDGEVADTFYSGAQLVAWVDGDWKLVTGSKNDRRQLLEEPQPSAAAPGSDEFDKQGWILLSGSQR